jgi:hypothetical protein
MKKIISDIYFKQRLFSSLNRSRSSAAYSFSHAPRFSKKNNLENYFFSFYDLPSQKSNRSTSLGYGKRFKINNNDKDKCKNMYNIPSSFDLRFHNSPQYSFGIKYKIKKILITI